MTAQQVLQTYGSAAQKKAQPSTMQTLADKAKSAWQQMESGANAAWAGGVQGYNDIASRVVPPINDELTKLGVTKGARNALQAIGVSPATANSLVPDGNAGGLSSLIQGPNGDPMRQYYANQKQDFQQQYGNNSDASVGRFAGQNLLTLPAVGAGGALLRAGGGALASGLSDAAPAISRGIQYATDFLGGSAGANRAGVAGIAERTASRAAGSAAAGAGYNGVSGDPIAGGAAAGAVLGPAGGAIGDAAKLAASKISPLLDPATRALAEKAE